VHVIVAVNFTGTVLRGVHRQVQYGIGLPALPVHGYGSVGCTLKPGAESVICRVTGLRSPW